MKVKTTTEFTGPKCNLEARKALKGYEGLGLPTGDVIANGTFFLGGTKEDGGIAAPVDMKIVDKIGDQILHVGKNKLFCGEASTVVVEVVVEGEEVED